jgi:predicted esterase
MELRSLEITRTARFAIAGDASKPIHTIWYVFHGYGQLANYFIRHFDFLAEIPNTLVVAPEGLSRFYLGTDEWKRVGASWMTKEDRESEITDQLHYLNVLQQMIEKEYTLSNSVKRVVFGFSQGAATAWRWIDRSIISPDHLVVWAGSVPEEFQRLSTLQRMKIWLVCGNNDLYINEDKICVIQQVIKSTGLAFSFLSFDGVHTIPTDVVRELHQRIQLNG